MAQFAIPNRPFATEPFTGLMTPDGIFEIAIGAQNINASIKNTGAAVGSIQVYIESVSDPGIVITPTTHYTSSAAGASNLFSWQADFTTAQPGKHLVSFIVQVGAVHQRIIQKIFVTKMNFNPATSSFSVTTPEGVLNVAFKDMIGPKDPKCCRDRTTNNSCNCANGRCDARAALIDAVNKASQLQSADSSQRSLLHYLSTGFKGRDENFTLCAPQLLIGSLDAAVFPTPPYTGQYGDLPFQDPWWKIVLAILAFLLLVAAAIAEAVDGSGDLTAGAGGTHDLPSSGGGTCCAPAASGGGTSKIAAGLLAAAAAVATVAGASDARDPFRKGQDHTAPATGTELTTGEKLKLKLDYPEAIEPGKAFKVGIDYHYKRITTSAAYDYSATETNANVHLLNKYVIDAPDVVHAYKREPFIVKAQFYDASDKLFRGDQLFVQCFVVGPAGQWRRFVLQDSGSFPDTDPNDGTYTGGMRFTIDDQGYWKYYVLAQDVNNAQPDLTPEQAAQIIGGMLLTNQLSITFEGGTCPLVPDGVVNVIA